MPESLEEAYRILEVAPSASWEEIRQAYREMVKVWHPDRFQEDEKFKARATKKVQDINAAYRVLEAHYQKPAQDPPAPQPQPTESASPPEPKEETHFWARSPEGLLAKITNGQPYQVFPCRMHGFNRYRQHLETIPTYLWIGGCVCLLSAFVIPVLVLPASLLIPASFIAFLWGKYERWKDPAKIRPDALLVMDDGLVVVQWVVEHTESPLHAAKTVFTIPWANLLGLEQNSSELILHVQLDSVRREFIVRPVMFEWILGKKYMGYFKHDVLSRDEFKTSMARKTRAV